MTSSDLKKNIQLARGNSPFGQKKVYEFLYSFGMSICVRYAENEEEAEEILHDGFLKLFDNLDTYNTELPIEPWFRTILIHSAIDTQRKRHKLSFTSLENTPVGIDARVNSIVSDLTTQEILSLVESLAPSYRIVFNLYVIEGYKHLEISKQLNITEASSRATLAVARQKLQEKILATRNFYKI